MSQIVYKMRKVLNGCIHKSNNKIYCDNDMNNPILTEDFKFDFDSPEPAPSRQIGDIPIYNDYDNLNHPSLAKNVLKDNTNIKKGKDTKRKFFMRPSKSNDENFNSNNTYGNENINYSGLYDDKKISMNNRQSLVDASDGYYCEIQHDENNSDSKPLIDFKQLKIQSEPPVKKLAPSFYENDSNQNTDIDKENKSLTDLRSPESFSIPEEGFHWYLNLLNDTIMNCITTDKTLKTNEANRTKRLNIAKAHLIYARNFYEMRIAGSASLKLKLEKTHPCLIVLACLLESEAVRIEESHVCVCDTYVYLFSTRLKYCAWKSKLFILLKKPKRSSFDRLNLIEDLTKCHKMVQEK